MPFARPALETLRRNARAHIEARLPGLQPALQHNLAGILADCMAGLTHEQLGYIDWGMVQVIPDTAEGEFLDRWARLHGLQRKPATVARGNATFTGSPGIVIEAGTEMSQPNGVTYRTILGAVISGGSALVPVEAITGGDAGNLPAGVKLNMTTAIPGLFNIATVATGGLIGGGLEEIDTALRGRLSARLSKPPQGGAAHDYVAWALEVPGVSRAWAYPLNRGAGTVDVAFVMDGRQNIIPTALDVALVQDAIDLRRPVTANSVVFAPTPQALNVAFSELSPSTAAVRAAITAEVQAQIIADAVPGGVIRKSRLMEAASRAAGEAFHTMSIPASNVQLGAGTIAIPGAVTFP
jgi:uncharacterized phage protein gp47/JayE